MAFEAATSGARNEAEARPYVNQLQLSPSRTNRVDSHGSPTKPIFR